MNCERCGKKDATLLEKRSMHPFYKKARWTILCGECLEHFDNLIDEASQKTFPKKPGEMVAGEHYYVEDGLFVFDEVYHYLRGSCCGNNCRHCVYGYKLTKRAQKNLF